VVVDEALLVVVVAAIGVVVMVLVVLVGFMLGKWFVFALFGKLKPKSKALLGGLVVLGGALMVIVQLVELAKSLELEGGGWVILVSMVMWEENLFLVLGMLLIEIWCGW
jgi:hypothetical protein